MLSNAINQSALPNMLSQPITFFTATLTLPSLLAVYILLASGTPCQGAARTRSDAPPKTALIHEIRCLHLEA